jgi:hypothetical protein
MEGAAVDYDEVVVQKGLPPRRIAARRMATKWINKKSRIQLIGNSPLES